MFTSIISLVVALSSVVSSYFAYKSKGASARSALMGAINQLAAEWRNRTAAGEKLPSVDAFLYSITSAAQIATTSLNQKEKTIIFDAYNALKARAGGA